MFSRRVRSKDLVVLRCCCESVWASRRANSSDCFHATVPLCRRRLMNLIGLFITLLKAACTHCQVPSSQSPVLHFKQWRCRYPSSIICGCAPIFKTYGPFRHNVATAALCTTNRFKQWWTHRGSHWWYRPTCPQGKWNHKSEKELQKQSGADSNNWS